MKTTSIAILCAALAAGVAFPLGYLAGNRKAAALAYEELLAVSAMGYEDCSTHGTKRHSRTNNCIQNGRAIWKRLVESFGERMMT